MGACGGGTGRTVAHDLVDIVGVEVAELLLCRIEVESRRVAAAFGESKIYAEEAVWVLDEQRVALPAVEDGALGEFLERKDRFPVRHVHNLQRQA